MSRQKSASCVECARWLKNEDNPNDYSRTHPCLEVGELGALTPENIQKMVRDIVRCWRRHEISGEVLCLNSGIETHAHGRIERLKVGGLRLPGEPINKGFSGDCHLIKADIFEPA